MGSRGRNARKPGPPKAFAVEAALDAAMRVFWHQGFHGASLTNLTAAMGIQRPSLYATFGDKQSLFRRTVAHYANLGATVLATAAAQPGARAFARTLLRGQADLYTRPGLPPGCYLVMNAVGISTVDDAARAETSMHRLRNEQAVRCELARPQRLCDLPPGQTPADIAAFLAAIGHGLAVRAADGASRADLHRIIDLALAFWPDTPTPPGSAP